MKQADYACRISTESWLGIINWYYFIHFNEDGSYSMTVVGPSKVTWRLRWRFFWTRKFSEEMWVALGTWQRHYHQSFPNAKEYLERLGFS